MMMLATMKEVAKKVRLQEFALETIFRKQELQPNNSTKSNQLIEGASKATKSSRA